MVVSDPEFSDRVDALRRIHRLTRETTQTLKSFIPPASTPAATSNAEILPLSLPFPNEVIAPIMSLKASDKIRTTLLRIFTQRVDELRQKCATNYQNACASAPWLTSPDRNNDLRQIYQDFYTKRCHFLVDSQLPYVLDEVASRQLSRPVERKASFNHEYTPVLENYFEHNAYPTLPDRLVLARKSMMSARQIEVWFQNHRNRAKKEGIPLKRLSSNIASKISFDGLAAKVPHLIIPKRDRSTTIETESSDEEDDSEAMNISETPSTKLGINLEGPMRPLHAFPLPYSKKNTVADPFSTENGVFKFPSPIWERQPATTSAQSSAIDMDDFAAKFASKLDLRAAPTKAKKPSKTMPAKYCGDKWFSDTVAALPASPHAASIPTHYVPVPSRARIPADYKHPVWQLTSLHRRKPSTSRLPHVLPSWTIPGEIPTCRKSPALPRRTPSTLHSCVPTPRSSLASCSRSSSSSSIATSDSRSTSTSSSSSMTSIDSFEVVTPSLALEQHVQDPSDFSDQIFDIFGDPQPRPMESYSHNQNLFNFDIYNKNNSIFDALSIPIPPFIPS